MVESFSLRTCMKILVLCLAAVRSGGSRVFGSGQPFSVGGWIVSTSDPFEFCAQPKNCTTNPIKKTNGGCNYCQKAVTTNARTICLSRCPNHGIPVVQVRGKLGFSDSWARVPAGVVANSTQRISKHNY